MTWYIVKKFEHARNWNTNIRVEGVSKNMNERDILKIWRKNHPPPHSTHEPASQTTPPRYEYKKCFSNLFALLLMLMLFYIFLFASAMQILYLEKIVERARNEKYHCYDNLEWIRFHLHFPSPSWFNSILYRVANEKTQYNISRPCVYMKKISTTRRKTTLWCSSVAPIGIFQTILKLESPPMWIFFVCLWMNITSILVYQEWNQKFIAKIMCFYEWKSSICFQYRTGRSWIVRVESSGGES